MAEKKHAEAAALLEEFLCGYQSILLTRGINTSEAVCKQNELIDEYAERIVQAIAATLSNETCEDERIDELEELKRENVDLEAKVNSLTAEQVWETVEKHGVNDGCVYSIFKGSFKAIADELNAKLGSGTCENLSSMNVDGVAGYHFICSECGLSVCASMGIGEIELSGPRSFRWKVDGKYEFEKCPRCGRKVKR